MSPRLQWIVRWTFAGMALSILASFALSIGIYEGFVRIGPK